MSSPPSMLKRRWVRALIALVLLVVAIRALLPFVAERVLVAQGSKFLGRVVGVENIDLELLAGRVHLDGLTVAQPLPTQEDAPTPVPDPDQAVILLGALDVDFSWLALKDGEIRLADVVLTEPGVELDRRRDGSLAPLVLAKRPPKPVSEEPEPEDEGGGWPIYVDSLELARSVVRLRLEDREDVQVVDFTLQRFGLLDFGFVDGGVKLGAVDIQQPEARVRRDLVAPAPGADEAGSAAAEEGSEAEAQAVAESEGEGGSGELPGLAIEDIQIERAEFTLATDEHEIDVGLALDASSVNLTTPFPLKLKLDVGNEGGFFALDGRLRVIPLYFDGAVQWAELPLVDMLDVAEVAMPLSFEGGSSKADLKLTYGADDTLVPEGITVSGTIAATGIALADVVDLVDIGWSDLAVTIAKAELPLGEASTKRGPVVALDRLELISPRLRYTKPAAPPGAADEPAAEEVAEAPAPAPPAPPKPTDPRIALTLLHVSDGTLDFVDQGQDPAWETQLRDLDLKLRDLTWPEKTMKSLALSSRGPGAATLELSGGLVEGRGTLELKLGGLELPGFAPYVRPALGQDISNGTLSLHTDLEAVWPDLTARNELVVYQLELAAADDPEFSARFGMPISVALALLRDTEGAITLEPEVVFQAGNLQLGPLVREALSEALQGALRAPLKGLTALSGVASGMIPGRDGPAFGWLAMNPGTTSLDAGSAARVGAIGEVLAERPTLAIALLGRSDSSDDPALAEQMLGELAAAKEDLPSVDGVGMLQRRRIRQALTERAGGEPGPLSPEDEAGLARMVATVSVPTERRLGLARQRAEVMKTDLIEGQGVAAGQVQIGEAGEGTPGVAGDLAVASASGASDAP